MKFKNIVLAFFLLFSIVNNSGAQDLWNLVDSAQTKQKDYVYATFKTTRLINQHTVEVLGKRSLDFRISHRFGPINSGSYNAWGIDGPANIKLSLEYSFDGRLMFGIGRSSFEKMVEGFLKYKLLRQTANGSMPVSLTLFSGMYYTALRDPNKELNGYDKYSPSSNRLSYNHQIIIARKFTNSFSLQTAAWYVHYNLVEHATDKNDVFGVSVATRLKFTKRSAVTFEYAWRSNTDYSQNTYYNSMGIGYELETGGHVFQIHLINSFGLSETQYLPQTTTMWNNAGVRIGFNISRVFTL